MEKYWLKNKEMMMNFRSSVNSLLAANRNEGTQMSMRTSSLIVGVVALVLAGITLIAAVLIAGNGAATRIPPNTALSRSLTLSSQPVSKDFVRSVALIGQNPTGYVPARGPVIGQSVFPGEAQARSLASSSQPVSKDFVRSVALTGQNPAGYVVARGPVIGKPVFPGEVQARSLALSSQPVSDAFVRSVALTGQDPVAYIAARGPVIGKPVFPGEAVARRLVLGSQAWVGYYGGK